MTDFAFVFPGQGAQSPGMGRELCEAFPASREVFAEADRALESDLSRLCFEGSAEELALTENTQPAILAVSIAALRALETLGVGVPAAAAGHSLGEYSAHVAAGTIGLADALRTVRLRGRFMQAAVPVGSGAMAAVVGLAPEAVAKLCAEAAQGQVVEPANFNAADQVVVAGDAAAVERASTLARAAGATRVVPLAVSAPFHCRLMQPAAEHLRPVLDALRWSDPGYPILANVDVEPVTRGEQARRALARQVASPVRWQETMEALIQRGLRTWVEVGPGRVLSGLARRARKDLRLLQAGDPESAAATAAALAAG